MQGMERPYNVGESGVMDHTGSIDLQWGKVKGAMDALLKSFHSADQQDGEALEDIFDYFVQKVEFDSPLAGPE